MKGNNFAVIFIILLLVKTLNLMATGIDTGWIDFVQPNGVKFIGRTWGDEFEHFNETKDGYRFVLSYENKYYYYAILNSKGDFTVSHLKVGIDNPATFNIPKNLERTGETRYLIDLRREQFNEEMKRIRLSRSKKSLGKRNQTQAVTTIEIAAILVEFDDVKHYSQYLLEDYNNMLTSVGTYNYWGGGSPHPQDLDVWGSVHDYYNDMSYGDINFVGGVLNEIGGSIDWIELDHTKYYYATHNYTVFLNEVLNKASAKGYNTSVSSTRISPIIYAGNFYYQVPLWPQTWGYRYSMFEEYSRPYKIENTNSTFAMIGIHCHEIGHSIFGFYDLYTSPHNISHWSLMGLGDKNSNYGACPAPINPLFRQDEGWIAHQTITSNESDKSIDYNYTSPNVFKRELSSSEYFLIENRYRQSHTFDERLPNDGILIWHINGWIIDIEEADNDDDLYVGNDGDCFPGTIDNRNFNDFTTPNSKTSTSSNSQFIVNNISNSGINMKADVGINWFSNISTNITFSDNVDVGDDLFLAAGYSLSIDPGATINFDFGTKLGIYGTLNSQGTSGVIISLTSANVSPSAGDWGGIKFYYGSNGSIEYTTIEYSDYGISTYYGSQAVSIQNTNIQNFSQTGVYNYFSNPTIQNCTISNNSGGSHNIYIYGSSGLLKIKNNIISNGPIGIEVRYSSGSEIDNNSISNCYDSGIKVYQASPEIYNNIINSCYSGVKLATGSSPDIHDNDFQSNQYGLNIDQSEPSRLKWNNFGNDYYDNDKGVRINYLTSGNTFADDMANNFYDGMVSVDVLNYTSVTFKATGNYWEDASFSGPVDASNPCSENRDAGPGGATAKIALLPKTSNNSRNIPDEFSLGQNYPNPFNPSTTIDFSVPKTASIQITIYDINSRQVRQLINNQTFESGYHNVLWDGRNNIGEQVASGIYLYRINCNAIDGKSSFTSTQKMLLTR